MKFKLEMFPKADVPNANGYVYTKECIENAIKEYDYNIRNFKAIGKFNGYLDHQIEGHNIAMSKDPIFKINSIYKEDDIYFASIESINTFPTNEFLKMIPNTEEGIASFESHFVIAWAIYATVANDKIINKATINYFAIIPKTDVV